MVPTRLLARRAFPQRWRDCALVRDDGFEIGIGGVALLNGARETVEPGEAFQLFGAAEFRGVQRAAQHGGWVRRRSSGARARFCGPISGSTRRGRGRGPGGRGLFYGARSEERRGGPES